MAIEKCGVPWSLIGLLFLGVFTIALSAATSSTAAPINALIVNPPSSPVPVSGSVAVANPASNPVPTQNVGGGAATLVGQPVSKLVDLDCNTTRVPPGPCVSKSTGSSFVVPSGQAFVATDLPWFATQTDVGQGNYGLVNLNSTNTQGGNSLAFVTAPNDARGISSGQAHFATGVVISSGNSVSLTTASATGDVQGDVQGYLVPSQ